MPLPYSNLNITLDKMNEMDPTHQICSGVFLYRAFGRMTEEAVIAVSDAHRRTTQMKDNRSAIKRAVLEEKSANSRGGQGSHRTKKKKTEADQS